VYNFDKLKNSLF